ncbi:MULTISPECIES: ABC transporter substrate-binding protein [Subtercola]|uniref:Extracellular solute-binding protein n=1 Tax=Subtercola vilae TaxID=2056433 RepID=A0A4T2BRJ9_9MICO|nr:MULTISPECIES: extracellular solute-binding protein [Subtercola]MEA9986459.1 extracellular solute-binding protein [Subtercola sp. RTI3]TIH34305.1 extracellular solute-binding protein [Subtercola vilae]
MRYKAVGALAASTLLVLGLAACSNDTGGSSANGKTTLTWASTTSEKPAVDAIVAAYEKANPDVTITTTTSDTDNYQTTLRTQLSSGTAPDVFFVWPGDGNPMAMTVVQKAGLIADLSNEPFAANIPAGIKPVSQIGGKTYIAPVTFSGIGATYNTTALKAANLTEPTTWTELLKFCGDAKAIGKAAFALAGGTPWNTQLIPYALTPTLVYGPTPTFAADMSAGKVTFATSAWKTALDKYKQMQDSGCFQDGDLGTAYEDALKLVSTGDAFASVQVNSSITAMQQAAPSGTTFSFDPLPANDDATSTRMAGAAGASYGVNASSKVKDAAIKFVDYLASADGTAVYSTAAAGIPAIPISTFKVDPALENFVKYQTAGKTDPFMDQLWPNSKVQQVHFEVLQQLLAGSLSSTDALKQMDAAYAEGEG